MSAARFVRAARIAAVLLATVGGGTAASAAAAKAAKAPASASAASAEQVEPGALQALARMGAYLRTNRTFQVKLETQRDDVDIYGQLLTFDGASTYRVRAPDGLSIDTREADEARRYVYDGKSVTVFDPKTGYYGHFPAPPTIRQTLDEAEAKYGIHLPLTDLFHWGEDPDQAKDITAAHYVGPAQVGGQAAQHYAFRQHNIDWQIWIADGDKPLPLRVVVVGASDPERPQFEADLTWDTSPQFAADTFVFTPPPQAKAIPMASADR